MSPGRRIAEGDVCFRPSATQLAHSREHLRIVRLFDTHIHARYGAVSFTRGYVGEGRCVSGGRAVSRIIRFVFIAAMSSLLVSSVYMVDASANTNCSTGFFCAWWNSSYLGDKVIGTDIQPGDPGSDHIDVIDDVISSAKNHMDTTEYCGMDAVPFAIDPTLKAFMPNTDYPGTSGPAWANNIDYFRARVTC